MIGSQCILVTHPYAGVGPKFLPGLCQEIAFIGKHYKFDQFTSLCVVEKEGQEIVNHGSGRNVKEHVLL